VARALQAFARRHSVTWRRPGHTAERPRRHKLTLHAHTRRLEAFAKRGSEPEGELQIYTWPDASLRELADLISDVTPEAQNA
jgi:hypothetical protein